MTPEMATEKTTIVTPISIRVTESMQARIDRLSDYHGMNRSEYLLSLVEKDERELQERYRALEPLFGGRGSRASDLA